MMATHLRLGVLLAWAITSAPAARSAPGDVLAEYRAELGTLPDLQGWVQEGQCLLGICPDQLGSWTCWWQGSRDRNTDGIMDNNCYPGTGCHLPEEHYNAPSAHLEYGFTCSFTEWLAFDNGEPGGGAIRPLHIPDAANGTVSVRVVQTPPIIGASIPGAPIGHWPLRLSTGSGSDLGQVLPTEPGNNRNGGRILIARPFGLPGWHAPVTVVFRGAFGPWANAPEQEFLLLRVASQIPGRHWRFGLNLDNVSGAPGPARIGVSNGEGVMAAGWPVQGVECRRYDPQTESWYGGRFHVLRLTCRPDGSFVLWFDENPEMPFGGTLGMPGMDDWPGEVQDLAWGMLDLAGGADCTYGCGKTIWVDEVVLLEGELPPPGCPVPVFDLNRDQSIDEQDLLHFEACATGPAVPPHVFENLPWACRCLDINADQSIDVIDFAAFQRCLTAEGLPPDPDCAH